MTLEALTKRHDAERVALQAQLDAALDRDTGTAADDAAIAALLAQEETMRARHVFERRRLRIALHGFASGDL